MAREGFHFRLRPKRASLAGCLAGFFLLAATARAQLTNVSISPTSGSSASGVAQTFTATYSDSLGAGYIADTYVEVSTYGSNAFEASACYVAWAYATNGIYLVNDGGTAWLGPITLGSSGTLQNSQCTLYGTGSSVTISGTQVTMNVRLSFTAAFAGTRGTYLWAYGTQGDTSAPQQMGTWTVNATGSPDLTIAMNHTPSSFTQGQAGTYNITVTNSGSSATSGTVTVTDSLPTGLAASGMSGSGWSCNVSTLTCTRSDTLAGGSSYPAIALTVNVASNASTPLTNYAYVSGGGELNTSNDSASDATTIASCGGCGGGTDLALNKAATQSSTLCCQTFTPSANLAVDGNTDGNFYDASVSHTNSDLNAWWQVDLGTSATVNSVVVWNRTDCCPERLNDYWFFVSNTPFLSTDTPSTLQSRAATWSNHQTTTPSPSTTVSPGGYSGRYVRVQLSGQNYLGLAEVQVYGSAGATPDLTITKSHTGSFTQGQTGATYTITATNSGSGATSGTVQVTDSVPTGLTATAMNGSGWSCTPPGGPCTRSDILAAGSSYPAITLTVNVAGNAPTSVTNSATVSGGGETNTGNDSASDVTTINICCGSTLATMASPANNTTLTGSTVTFTWNPGSGAIQYFLYVGTTGVGSNDIMSANVGSSLSQTVSGLPVNGNTVYVRLWTFVSGWQYNDYTYAAYSGGGTPVLTIAKSHIGNFSQGQTGATYTITVNNNGSGATSGTVTVTDTLPTGLTASGMSGSFWSCALSTPLTCTNTAPLSAGGSYPITLTVSVANNAPVSVTNSASVSGGGSGPSSANDATTITGPCGTQAIMTSPAQGSTLSGSTVTFTWNPACGGPQLWLYVGTTGIGSLDIFSQSEVGGPSQAVPNIPTSGGTIYVRLWTYLNGVWQFNDYTYVAAGGTGSGVDPRRIGVRSTGSYWGAAGEQIDLLSGNLNFTLALMQPQARGWGATIALSYNSQIWKRTGTTNSELAVDVGYGLGWLLQAGSIVPSAPYTFRDSTGAEYLLDQCVSGICTSKQGTYVTFDSTATPSPKLYFPDGSFWVMGAKSAPGEPDAGTWHPTVMEDSNGNQIQIQYALGAGSVTGANNSARILSITDTRATGGNYTYSLQYNTDAIPHLTSITNSVQSAESYTFSTVGQALQSPFDSSSFGTATLLTGVTVTASNTTYGFQYSTGAAELTQVTTPASGTLGWGYRTFAYSSGISYREVNTRSVQPSSGGTTYTWGIGLDSVASGHISTKVTDNGAGTSKVWNFLTTTGPLLGLASMYQEQNGAAVAALEKDYTWTQDSAGTPYIGTVKTTLDPGLSYAAQTRADQVLDIYGNVTSSGTYDYGNPTAPATPSRTYASSYLTGRRNRLNSSSVTPAGGQAITLVTNTYDGGTLTDRPGLVMHDAAYGTSNTSRGNLTRSVTPGAARNISYDIGGMAVNAHDDYGHSVAITLTSATNFSLPGTIQPNGNTILQTTTAYNAAFQPVSVADPNNATATQHYATNGRIDSSTSPSGIPTTYAYNDAGHTVTATTGARAVTSTYDGFGRTVKVVVSDGGVVKSTVDTQYGPCACSPLGKMTQVSQPYAPGDTVRWTVYTYDASGRTLTVTAPDGVSKTTYSYQGNLTTVTDPLGKWKQYTTDSNGNLVLVTEPNPAGGNLTTTYSYDTLNHLTGVSMPRGGTTQTRSWTYDGSTQRLTQATAPESGTTQYVYNADGTPQYKLDQKGQKTQYTYDQYGRTILIDYYPAGSGQPDLCQEVTLNYDEFNLPAFGTLSWQLGRLTSVQWSQASTCAYHFQEQYQYTSLGQVTLKRFGMANGSSSYLYIDGSVGYDLEGRMTNYQSGLTTGTSSALGQLDTSYTYQRDGLGRLTGLTYGPTTLVSGVTYGAAGQLQQMVFNDSSIGPGFTETRTYNANLQLTRLTSAPTSGTGMDLEYRYGAAGAATNGRVWQVKDWASTSGEEVTYQYDALNRLTQATTTDTTQWGLSFQYDGFGNLTGQTRTQGTTAPSFAGTIDGTTNRRTDTGYQYDVNGNVTQMPDGTTYSYDGANRLINRQLPNDTAYDLSNRRVWDGSRIYYYGPNGQLLAKYQPYFSGSSNFQRTSVNVWFGRKLIRETDPGNASHQRWVMTDRLGSVRVNGDGQRSNYYPYGQEMQATPDGRTKFATYYRDAPGLDYANQRYYSNAGGRFLTPDPSSGRSQANPGSWNRYAYTMGDPINGIDPKGKFDCFVWEDSDTCLEGTVDPCNDNITIDGFAYTPNPADCVDMPPPDSPGEEAWKCPGNYQDWIHAHGADAAATGLSEANVLATSAIESGWGGGPFVKGNSFFNLETLWKPGTKKPDPKYAYQVSWMPASEAFLSGPHKGWFSLVASYNSASDSFKSFAATLGTYLSGVTDAAKFASILVAHGINAGRASYFGSTMQTFQDCLSAQK